MLKQKLEIPENLTPEEAADWMIQHDPITGALKKQKEIILVEEQIKAKRLKLDLHRLTMQERKLDLFLSENSLAEHLNLDDLDEQRYTESAAEYARYLEGAKNKKMFILPELDCVPLFKENLILLGGRSGANGSKTHTAIEVMNTIIQQNGRVLFITNEESVGSVMGRLAFMTKNWHYTDLKNITPIQEKWVSEFQNSFYKEKKVSIIDDNLRGLSKAASSIEGLEAILSSVVRNKNNFDCIIIDYFHKINESKENPTQSEIEVLTNVCNMLDRYRKLLPCAVVLFAQLHPSSAERDDFESRIKGRRKIFEPATFVAEIIPNRDTKITTFKIEKNRFENSTVGQQIQIGFDTRTGRFRSLNDPLFAHQLETNKNNIQKIIEDELKTEKSKKGKTK